MPSNAGPLTQDARLVAFILITDPQRARSFYEGTLGLRFLKNDGFALVFEFNGTMLRAGISESLPPSQNTVLGWEVKDIARAARDLTKAGVVFRQIPGRQQDELSIWTAPDGSKVAWFQDPDGNWLSVSQHSYAPVSSAV
jgi:catechol 2,3-dioxygenase-like lactoylglutathione lyase family enzyme